MSRINRRKLKLSEVEITIDTEEEDMSIEGYFDDKALEQEIIESYGSGNGYAWCCVIVTAKWTDPSGHEHVGRDTLGGVSCLPTEQMTARESFDALVKDHGMPEQALADLQREVNRYDRGKARDAVLDVLDSLSPGLIEGWGRNVGVVGKLGKAVLKMRRIPK
jgi:hypothetical protein